MKHLKTLYILAVLISIVGPWQLINCSPLKASRIHTLDSGDAVSSSENTHMRLIKRSVQVSQNEIIPTNENIRMSIHNAKTVTKLTADARQGEANIFDKFLVKYSGNHHISSPYNTPHLRSKRTIMFLIMKHGIKKFFKFFLLG